MDKRITDDKTTIINSIFKLFKKERNILFAIKIEKKTFAIEAI
jgi:hypothetical protein